MGNAFQYIALAVNDGSNVAFHIGNMAIYWYGIIIAAGLIAGVLIGIYEAKRKGYRSEMVLDFILIAIPICIICARLYYVIFEWDMFSPNLLNIFNIRSGGLAIYGAVIGGVIAALIFYRWRRVSIGELLDITAPGLIIGQAIGAGATLLIRSAFGRLITDPKLYWFPYAGSHYAKS
jgi:phosphatidylglycerol:prolipoprotein diacylglycerol transferase